MGGKQEGANCKICDNGERGKKLRGAFSSFPSTKIGQATYKKEQNFHSSKNTLNTHIGKGGSGRFTIFISCFGIILSKGCGVETPFWGGRGRFFLGLDQQLDVLPCRHSLRVFTRILLNDPGLWFVVQCFGTAEEM